MLSIGNILLKNSSTIVQPWKTLLHKIIIGRLSHLFLRFPSPFWRLLTLHHDQACISLFFYFCVSEIMRSQAWAHYRQKITSYHEEVNLLAIDIAFLKRDNCICWMLKKLKFNLVLIVLIGTLNPKPFLISFYAQH